MVRERTDAGTFVETVTLDAVRAVFDQVRGPAVTSSDVADALDCTTEAARQKLQRLYDRGEVDKRKAGRTVLYWRAGLSGLHAPAGNETDDAESTREPTGTTPTRGASTPGESTPSDAGTTEADSAIAAVVDDVASGWEDSPDRLEARKRAARAVLEYAAESDDAVGKGTAADRFLPEYAVGGQSAETWWRKNIRPVLQAVGEYDNGRHGYVVDLHAVAGDDPPAGSGGIYDPTEEFD